ncbi:4-hydroxybutyrate coenzyme A transferase [Chitinispirillum alkaliphilum]|nr:4-hydroxybutyrate coenzyme A transferase [Chitinispirillum alkaliphilum]
MPAWETLYEKKVMDAESAIRKINPGDRIFIGTGCGQPQTLVDELVKDGNNIVDSEIYHFLTQGDAPYIKEEYAKKFRAHSFFLAENVREAIAGGRGDYLPIYLSEIPTLFRTGRLPIDVALVQTSPPDRNGNLSLGISVDIVKAAAENSLTIIVEVNPNMPRTMGDSFIPVEMVDAVVLSQRDLLEYNQPKADPVTEAIALNIASLIEDGSTLEVGIGNIPQAVLSYLEDKKDLGIHTEMFNESIIPLVEKGIVNGSRKTKNRGKITASFCMGSRKLYDFVHENPIFEFRPSEYVNDPNIISEHNRMVAINEAVEVDMTGQVCSDSVGYKFHSGIGGLGDFNRGASRARDGKSIVALRSTSPDGKASKIVPKLTEGAGVVLNRADVHYIVTEYGIVNLFGKNIRERVLALAEIAHPDFRNEILKEAKTHSYIYPHQKELPSKGPYYPKEYETSRTLSDGTNIHFRPIRPSDETALRDMFYALSEQSIAFRFYEPTKSFPQQFIQDFTTIDYSNDMAIAAVVQDVGGEQIVGIAHYYLNKATKMAEISFAVRDDWQSKGIGTYLMNILTDIARKRGVEGFEAKVLVKNELMLSVFYNSGYEVKTKLENDTYQISYNFKDK